MRTALLALFGAAVVCSTVPGSAAAAAPAVVEYPLAAGAAPRGIVLAQNGNDVQFAESGRNRLATLGEKDRYTDRPLPAGVGKPGAVVLGPDGAVWVAQGGRTITRVQGGKYHRFSLPAGSRPKESRPACSPLDRRAGNPEDRPHVAHRVAPANFRSRAEPRATQPRASVPTAPSGSPSRPRGRWAGWSRPPASCSRSRSARQRAGRHRRRAGRQPLGDRTHRGAIAVIPPSGKRPARRLSAARRQSSFGDRYGRRRRPLVYRSRALGARPDHHRRHRLVVPLGAGTRRPRSPAARAAGSTSPNRGRMLLDGSPWQRRIRSTSRWGQP